MLLPTRNQIIGSAVFGLVLLLPACQAPSGPTEPTAQPLLVASVEDLGPLSMPTAVIARDGGASALIRGKILWTFGDTFLNVKAEDGTALRSSTAAWSDPSDALNVMEPLNSQSLPSEFIPFTAAESADNARDILNGWALWPGPTLLDDGSHALITYQLIRRSKGSGFASQGLGIARVVPGETVAVRDPSLLFTPPEPLFGSGGAMVDDQYVYLYECSIISYLNMGCKLARVPRAQVDLKSAYLFYDGSSWISDITQAKVVMEHASAGLTVNWNAHLGQYLAVHSELLGNRIQLRTAPFPEGPWSDAVTVGTSDTGIQPATASGATNYLGQEHHELSSTDGSAIVVGYSRPLSPFHGEVRLARIKLQ